MQAHDLLDAWACINQDLDLRLCHKKALFLILSKFMESNQDLEFQPWLDLLHVLVPTCPWLKKIASTSPSTVLSKSAVSNTTTGDLPPSSREIFLPVPAVSLRRILPTWYSIDIDTLYNHVYFMFRNIKLHLHNFLIRGFPQTTVSICLFERTGINETYFSRVMKVLYNSAGMVKGLI